MPIGFQRIVSALAIIRLASNIRPKLLLVKTQERSWKSLNVKEMHSRVCVEMCLNRKLLLAPSGGVKGWTNLFLRLNWGQLIVDRDGKSSNVGLVVLLHAHSCLKSGKWIRRRERAEKGGEPEGGEKEKGKLIHHHAPSRVASSHTKLFHQIYLSTIDAAHRWSLRSRLKMRVDDPHPAWRQRSIFPDPCRTTKSTAPPLRERQRGRHQHVQSSTWSPFPYQCRDATSQRHSNMATTCQWWAEYQLCSSSMANPCDWKRRKFSHVRGFFGFSSLDSRHEWLHIMLDILTVKRAV